MAELKPRSNDASGVLALVIWGDRNALLPRTHVETFARELPNAKLAMIPGGGHYS